MINKLIGPIGLILFCTIIVTTWFRQGLMLAGAEEQLSFYNFTKSLDLFSYPWHSVGTGMPTLLSLSRVPYFIVFEYLYRIGFSSVFLQALTFFIIIITGILSVYYLLKQTLEVVVEERWKNLVPFLGALFYFLNPFAMTQIWGRALSYQFFVFALVPSFLLFFVLSIKRRNLIYCVLGVLLSIAFSGAYASPSTVVSSWSAVGIYLIFYIYISRNNFRNILFALSSFLLLFFLWVLVNFFWIYPLIKHGNEFLTESLTVVDSINSLKGLSHSSHIYNVIRLLLHREYYVDTYGTFYNSTIVVFISWLLPIFALFSISVFKKSKYFLFYSFLLVISIFVCIGANLPTGPILIWLLKQFPLMQVLRNPYEKFGVNLILAYAPFAAIGMLRFAEKLSAYFKKEKLSKVFLLTFIFLEFVILVWPYWKGNFAGGVKTNFWVQVPDYYEQANQWLNSQAGDFNILHLPLLTEDGITYIWQHPYEGIDGSEYLFDKRSIARNFVYNRDYYSALLDRFGADVDYTKLPNWSTDNLDFKDVSLVKELAKLNLRYIILHYDTNYKFRKSKSPQETKVYLEKQDGIKKINQFGKLEIYSVDIPNNINLVYSPDLDISYEKMSITNYLVDVKNAKGDISIYLLQQFHPSWQALINGEKIENHSKVFSYANKWKINKTGNYQVVIKFVQQETVNFGAKVAILTVGGLILSLIFYFLRKIISVK